MHMICATAIVMLLLHYEHRTILCTASATSINNTRGTDACYESANRCPIGVAVQIVRNFGWIDRARWEPTHAHINGEQLLQYSIYS